MAFPSIFYLRGKSPRSRRLKHPPLLIVLDHGYTLASLPLNTELLTMVLKTQSLWFMPCTKLETGKFRIVLWTLLVSYRSQAGLINPRVMGFSCSENVKSLAISQDIGGDAVETVDGPPFLQIFQRGQVEAVTTAAWYTSFSPSPPTHASVQVYL